MNRTSYEIRSAYRKPVDVGPLIFVLRWGWLVTLGALAWRVLP